VLKIFQEKFYSKFFDKAQNCNLFEIKLIWDQTYLRSNLFEIKLIWDQTYLRSNLRWDQKGYLKIRAVRENQFVWSLHFFYRKTQSIEIKVITFFIRTITKLISKENLMFSETAYSSKGLLSLIFLIFAKNENISV